MDASTPPPFFLTGKKKSPLCVSSASPRLTLTPAPLPTGQNLKGDKFGLENTYQHFQPSLENVDPTTEVIQDPPPTPHQGLLPFPHPCPPSAWGIPWPEAGHCITKGPLGSPPLSHPAPSSTFRGPRW